MQGEKITIHVKTLIGKTFSYEVAEDEHISNIKDKLAEEPELNEYMKSSQYDDYKTSDGNYSNPYRLSFSGKQLEPHKTFKEYNIQNNHTLHAVRRTGPVFTGHDVICKCSNIHIALKVQENQYQPHTVGTFKQYLKDHGIEFSAIKLKKKKDLRAEDAGDKFLELQDDSEPLPHRNIYVDTTSYKPKKAPGDMDRMEIVYNRNGAASTRGTETIPDINTQPISGDTTEGRGWSTLASLLSVIAGIACVFSSCNNVRNSGIGIYGTTAIKEGIVGCVGIVLVAKGLYQLATYVAGQEPTRPR